MAVAEKFMDDISFEVGESFDDIVEAAAVDGTPMTPAEIFEGKEKYTETMKDRKVRTAR